MISNVGKFFNLPLLVYYKEYNLGTAKWKRSIGQSTGVGEQGTFHALSG